MAASVFFYNFIATSVPPHLLYNICLTSLFDLFWAIQQVLFFMSILKKIRQIPNKKTVVEIFFGRAVGLQHANLLKWNFMMSVFFGITEIIFWHIFQSSYYIKEVLWNPCK